MVLEIDCASGKEQFLKLSLYVERDGDCHMYALKRSP